MDTMKNKALNITISTAVLAAFGAFLRWLQNQVSFELDTGLAKTGSMWPWVTAVWILLAAIILWVQSGRMTRQEKAPIPVTYAEAFAPMGRLSDILGLIFGFTMMVGGVLLIMTVPPSDQQRLLLRIVGGIAVICGIGFPVQLAGARSERPGPAVVFFAGLPILLYAFWLVESYKANIINPTITAYAVEILTICAMGIGFYQMAGYAFDRPKPARAIFWAHFAAFFAIVSLSDVHYFAVYLILLASGLMLMLQAFLIGANTKPVGER